MDSSKKKYYDQCEDCEYAFFQDFETMNCSKSVKYQPNTDCAFFEKPKSDRNINIFANGEYIEIVEEIERKELEIEEKFVEKISAESSVHKNKTIQIIKTEKKDENAPEVDYRFYTLMDVDIYDNPDLGFRRKIRTEPSNKLIPFHREVIRNNLDMIMLKDKGGKKSYLVKDSKKLLICGQCKVKEKPLDILLMQHSDFDKYVESAQPEVRIIKEKFEEDVDSTIEQKYGRTTAMIKDTFKKDGKYISTLNIITFKSQFTNIKLGRLASDSQFYIIDTEGSKKIQKIITDNGLEGILISNKETYKEILPPLQEFVSIIVILTTLAILIGGVITIMEETGYIIIIGIVIIPIAYLVSIFIGAPIYLILNQLIRRF